jgi:prevent-host-death family protein
MTKTWKLEDAKTQFSRLIRDAEQEPQIILRHGKPVAVVSPLPPGNASGMSALQALRGNFDFTTFPDDDWLERDRRTEVRDLEW